MKYLYTAFNWIFGILFGLMGLASLVETPLGGLCLLAISALFLPPIRNAVYSKTNKKLSDNVRVLSIFILLFAFSIFIRQSQDNKANELATQQTQEQAEQAAKARQEAVNYFNSNREKIVSAVSAELSKKNYLSAISQSKKYLAANDVELNDLYAQANQALDELTRTENIAKEKTQREERTKAIMAELKTISASEFKKNKDLYMELAMLNPDNSNYQDKVKYFSQKLNEQIENDRKEQERLKNEQEIRIAKFGEPPEQIVSGGSYFAVVQYLESTANDPDSIEIDSCTEVYPIKNGWLVGCNYRGRNAFGGMIRQSNWFTISHDRVTQMLDSTAYQP